MQAASGVMLSILSEIVAVPDCREPGGSPVAEACSAEPLLPMRTDEDDRLSIYTYKICGSCVGAHKASVGSTPLGGWKKVRVDVASSSPAYEEQKELARSSGRSRSITPQVRNCSSW